MSGKQGKTISADWDRTSRLAVKNAKTLDGALKKNPYIHGSKHSIMWLQLTCAKWAIVHNETFLVSVRP